VAFTGTNLLSGPACELRSLSRADPPEDRHDQQRSALAQLAHGLHVDASKSA